MLSLWERKQANYFYGEIEIFELSANGAYRQGKARLNREQAINWQSLGEISPSGMNELIGRLESGFFAFEQEEPEALLPDDFGWEYTVNLGKRRHQLKIYANSPPEQRAFLAEIEALIRSGLE